MKKLLFLLLIPVFGIAQNTFSNNIYLDADIHFAMSFKKIVADVINEDNNIDDYKTSIGGSAFVGYQPINRIGLEAGFKYSYLGKNAGTMYFLFQPKVFFGEGEESSFVYLNFGGSLTTNEVRNARIYGIGISDLFSAGERHSFYYGVFLENQRLDFGAGFDNHLLFGLKLGFILNTRKYQ